MTDGNGVSHVEPEVERPGAARRLAYRRVANLIALELARQPDLKGAEREQLERIAEAMAAAAAGGK